MASALVLLVDDDDLILDLVSLQLQASGFDVLPASTGAQAIHLLSTALNTTGARIPDLLITDMQMPDMDGAALCRHLRTLPLTNSAKLPKLIATSASQPPASQLRDFDAFLLKPLNLAILHQILTTGPIAPATKPAPISTAPLDPAVLNSDVLKKLGRLMPPDALEELITAFLYDTRARLLEMETHLANHDEAALRRCAHMIKGSAAMTGALAMAHSASLLESTQTPPAEQKLLLDELRCACSAIEGTLAQSARRNGSSEAQRKEAHDQQISRPG